MPAISPRRIAIALIPLAGWLAGCGSGTENGGVAHDFTTPEGAILCLEDAYRAEDIEAAVRCKDFRVEARLMLATLQADFSGDEEILTRTAEVLELAFRQEIQTEGFPDFDGVQSTFPAKTPYEGHDDIVIVTEVCTLPGRGKRSQQILVAQTESGWRVLNVLDE